MANNVMELLQGIIGELKVIAKSETVVGQPVTTGDRTVIPITRISVGFGAGGGEGSGGKDEKSARFGGGGGGGAVIDPIAFLVLEKDKVSLLTAKRKGVFEKVIEAAPDALAALKNLAARTCGDSGKKDDSDSE